MKKITLHLDEKYCCRGVSDLSLWGGGNACIEMQRFEVKRLKEIRDKINDNRFGVESINGAIVEIWRVYKDGNGSRVEKYARTVVVGEVSQNTFDWYYEN